MERRNRSLLQILLEQTKDITSLFISVVVVIGIIILLIIWFFHSSKISIENKNHTTISETQIQSMKDIGEWEFLSINDEELVDTVRHHLFTDDELTRIYYGTLRLGINMQEVSDGWITLKNDTIIATLPPIKLLDENFIDEARTKAFFEHGKWDQHTRAVLYERAKRRMLKRCLTQSNIKSAEQNASAQFYQLLQSMGFKNIKIRFDKPDVSPT